MEINDIIYKHTPTQELFKYKVIEKRKTIIYKENKEVEEITFKIECIEKYYGDYDIIIQGNDLEGYTRVNLTYEEDSYNRNEHDIYNSTHDTYKTELYYTTEQQSKKVLYNSILRGLQNDLENIEENRNNKIKTINEYKNKIGGVDNV